MIASQGGDAGLRRAFAAGAELASPGEECPDAQTLWAAAAGELPAAERRAIVDHSARCAACAEDFRILTAMAKAAPGVAALGAAPAAAAGAVVVGPWGALRRHRPLFTALAAMLLVGLLLAYFVPRDGRLGPGEVERGGEESPIHSLLGPGEPALPRAAATLRWQGPAQARYALTVTTADLQVVAEAQDLTAASFTLSPATLAPYPAGTRLRWRVEALLADGKKVASPVFVVVLTE